MIKNKQTFFKQIYDDYNQLVRSVVYLHIQNEQCHDVTQEIFVKAWKNLSSLKDIEKVKSWLMRITMNSIYDYFRKNKRIQEYGSDEEGKEFESKEDQFKKLEDKEIVKMMLSKLSDKHREVVILYYLLDFKISEIADSLHINEGTVKSRLYNAKEQLKDLANKWGVEYATI
jgi:RNA polymerase sigma-70 factor (ECF subfamily)